MYVEGVTKRDLRFVIWRKLYIYYIYIYIFRILTRLLPVDWNTR